MAWKWDVTISDRSGWKYFTMGIANLEPDGQVVVQFLAGSEEGIIDDFFVEHADWVTLSSRDGGPTWQRAQRNWFPGHFPLVLKDGTWLDIVEEHQCRSREEQKARLESLGLGHIWRDDCWFFYDLWPATMAGELRQQGIAVWDIEAVGGARCIPPGTVAAVKPGLVARRSSDQGRTWTSHAIERLPELSLLFNFMNRGLVLDDNTVLVSCCATEKGEPGGASWGNQSVVGALLRSTDGGITWTFIPVARGLTFEGDFLLLPSGRILALMRADRCIFKAYSDDAGLTWSQPEPTPMWGFPLHGLVLRSGSIVCTYGYRKHPAGVRGVCISRDEGKTWDITNEKILRCDSLPTHWIGGPVSVQLPDDTILTVYTVPRLERAKPEDRVEADRPLLIHPPHHTYLVASRYTEDYVKPNG